MLLWVLFYFFVFLNLSFCAAWIPSTKLKDVINKDLNKVLKTHRLTDPFSSTDDHKMTLNDTKRPQTDAKRTQSDSYQPETESHPRVMLNDPNSLRVLLLCWRCWGGGSHVNQGLFHKIWVTNISLFHIITFKVFYLALLYYSEQTNVTINVQLT